MPAVMSLFSMTPCYNDMILMNPSRRFTPEVRQHVKQWFKRRERTSKSPTVSPPFDLRRPILRHCIGLNPLLHRDISPSVPPLSLKESKNGLWLEQARLLLLKLFRTTFDAVQTGLAFFPGCLHPSVIVICTQPLSFISNKIQIVF